MYGENPYLKKKILFKIVSTTLPIIHYFILYKRQKFAFYNKKKMPYKRILYVKWRPPFYAEHTMNVFCFSKQNQPRLIVFRRPSFYVIQLVNINDVQCICSLRLSVISSVESRFSNVNETHTARNSNCNNSFKKYWYDFGTCVKTFGFSTNYYRLRLYRVDLVRSSEWHIGKRKNFVKDKI